jgi:hypothetical protein
LHGLGATLVGAGVVHRRLEVLGGLEFHVHPNVIRYPADEELSSLLSRHPRSMASEGLEVVGEVLRRGGE